MNKTLLSILSVVALTTGALAAYAEPTQEISSDTFPALNSDEQECLLPAEAFDVADEDADPIDLQRTPRPKPRPPRPYPPHYPHPPHPVPVPIYPPIPVNPGFYNVTCFTRDHVNRWYSSYGSRYNSALVQRQARLNCYAATGTNDSFNPEICVDMGCRAN